MDRQCSDCKLALEMIRVIDATQPGYGSTGATHVDLHYAPIDASKSWFTRSVKGALPITGMICPQCRRISLFG